jgi:hypothetical protein
MEEHALVLLREHEADGALPTNGRFLFYEAKTRGYVRKSERGESRRGGAADPREQDLIDALTRLRDRGVVPWDWITDETRTLYDWETAATVHDYVIAALDGARINPWAAELPPLYLAAASLPDGKPIAGRRAPALDQPLLLSDGGDQRSGPRVPAHEDRAAPDR